MDAELILCPASVLQMEILGIEADLAAAACLGETGTSYAVSLGVGRSVRISGDARASKSLHGSRVCRFARAFRQSFRQRARSGRRYAVWLPGRDRAAKSV